MNDKTPKIVIAIDGFSSSGKSTLARSLAKRLGYRYIDSGAMYRAVTLYALRHDIVNDSDKLISALKDINIDFGVNPDGSQDTLLNGENVEKEIRGMEVSKYVSKLATIPEVRRAMVKAQKAFGVEKGIVMDGRDITTKVFPDAELKIFVDASAETRAMRRYNELKSKDDNKIRYEDVLENIKQRDYSDTHRDDSPMFVAPDAVVLDNSSMTIAEQNDWIDRQVKLKFEELRGETDR